MIVTFRPTVNTGADYTACYINFLRCVTAIATASAGTTTLTVNPYTASNTIDTTKNCIISIDNNTEAGGWTTSASHAVPSSGNNTATTYTALASAAVHLYKADFYNASGKSGYPYKKLSFHWYANQGNSYNYWTTNSYTTLMPRSSGTAFVGANMLITFGCSSSTDWTSTTYTPATDGEDVNSQRQTTSYTLNGVARSTGNNLWNNPGLFFTDTTVEYHMAITADYCIIWESKISDTFLNGYYTSTGWGGPSANYWNRPRGGSIFYMGLRESQPWENAQNNNPPWTCWSYTADSYGTGAIGSPFPPNQVAAFMNTLNNNNVATTTPKVYRTTNSFDTNYFFGATRNSNESGYATSGHLTATKEVDGPIFVTRMMSNVTQAGEYGLSNNMLYMPAYDTTQGLNVPPAVPIKISRSYTDDWNQGGACRGIYKSLSMPWTTQKLYWQAATQTVTVGTDTYIPFVLNTDMWLVRYA